MGLVEPSAEISVTDVYETYKFNMRCRGANGHGRGTSRGLAASLRGRGGSSRGL